MSLVRNIIEQQSQDQIKKIGETHLNAKIQMLEELLKEAKDEEYKTFSQLKGSIESNLDILNKVKNNQ